MQLRMPLLDSVGSPPRVRSRPVVRALFLYRFGITSACAEQTHDAFCCTHDTMDHLRVCGADMGSETFDPDCVGSPPRVRSRPDGRGYPRRFSTDHLRVCGADGVETSGDTVMRGSPPRVRSRRTVSSVFTAGTGITSACAEQTPTVRGRVSV